MPNEINQQEGVKVPENKGLLDIEAQIIGETAFENGTGWTEENLINIRKIIAKTLAKIREVVEGAELTDEEIRVGCNRWIKDEPERLIYSYYHAVAQAQLQAILKAIDKEDK